MNDTKGCCGHPPSCTNAGRCKAYEEFNEQADARKIHREKIRKRRERKAQRTQRRGDTGRTMDR